MINQRIIFETFLDTALLNSGLNQIISRDLFFLAKRMRWRAFYYLSQQKCDNNIKETFGFTSRKCPTPCSDLIPFEKDLSDMVTSLKFRHVKDSFQRELNEDIRKIKSSPNDFVFADKTNSICEMPKDHHQKVSHDNFTKTYQKASPKLEASIN